MLYLWIFGDNIEASMGHKRYLVFYLLCGVAAAIAQVLVDPNSDIPMIGASGAVSGILGAYIVISPRANVKVFVFLIIITVINLPAFIVLGVWFLGQLVSQSMANPNEPGVAFMAHIGGFIAGAMLVAFFKRRNVHVFQPSHSRPFAVARVRRGRGSVPEFNPRGRGPWD
jgi:membrane associated rhomboid family serine protease